MRSPLTARACMAGFLLLTILLGSATARAVAGALPAGCPSNPAKCTYAEAQITVGPLMVSIMASADNGSAEIEDNVTVAPGGEGTVTIGVSGNASTQGQTYNVSFRVDATEGLTWTTPTNATFAYEVRPGFSEIREFRYRVAENATGLLPIPLHVAVDDESASTHVTLSVATPQEATEPRDTPAPAILLTVGMAALLALARRRPGQP